MAVCSFHICSPCHERLFSPLSSTASLQVPHMGRVFILVCRETTARTPKPYCPRFIKKKEEGKKEKSLLPNLPAIQISPTYHFKHNNMTISILRKRSRQYIMLWSFPCELSVISGAAGDGLEKSGVLLKFPLCKL